MAEHNNKNLVQREKAEGMMDHSPDDSIIFLSTGVATLGFCWEDIFYLDCSPNCLGLGGACSCCCNSCDQTLLKKSEIAGEVCIFDEQACKCIYPDTCCSIGRQDLFLISKVAYPARDSSTSRLKSQDPCALAAGGVTCCLDGKCKCSFCQPLWILRKSGDDIFVPGWCTNPADLLAMCTCHMSEKVKVDSEGNIDGKSVNKALMDSMVNTKQLVGKTPVAELYPFLGCPGLIVSGFQKMPDMMGCNMEGTELCLQSSCTCCKPILEPGEVLKHEMWLCCRCRDVFVWPRSFWKAVCQCCCADCRCSFPPECVCGTVSPETLDALDVPCMLNLCYINCCLDCACNCGQTCTHPLGELRKAKRSVEPSDAVTAKAM